MLVPGKVVMRNVPYNMKEETMKALISAEGLPDPREVTLLPVRCGERANGCYARKLCMKICTKDVHESSSGKLTI